MASCAGEAAEYFSPRVTLRGTFCSGCRLRRRGFTAQISGQPASGLLLFNLPMSPWFRGSNYRVAAHRWEGHVIWDCSFSLWAVPEQPWTHSPFTHQKWKALRWGWIFFQLSVRRCRQISLFTRRLDFICLSNSWSTFEAISASCRFIVAFIGCKHFWCQFLHSLNLCSWH